MQISAPQHAHLLCKPQLLHFWRAKVPAPMSVASEDTPKASRTVHKWSHPYCQVRGVVKSETDLLKSRPHSPIAQQRGCPASSLSAESVFPSQDFASCGCTPAVKYSEVPGEVSQISRALMLLFREEPVMMQAEMPAFFALSITASLSCTEQDAPSMLGASKARTWHCHKAVPHDMDVCQKSMHETSWSGCE